MMSSMHDITLDQQVALKTAATRLSEQFAGVFNLETIERFLKAMVNPELRAQIDVVTRNPDQG